MKLKKSTIPTNKPKSDKSKHYVDNDAFYEALKTRKKLISEGKEESLEYEKVYNYIGQCIALIAQKLTNSKSFFRYTYKDEMAADAIVTCIRYIDKFDPDKSTNAFGYFTKICNYEFINRLNREKTQTYVKFKMTRKNTMNRELMELDEHSDTDSVLDGHDFNNNYIDEFIKEYEDKIQRGKDKLKAKKEANKPKSSIREVLGIE